jgi:cation transport ATPase
VTDRAARPAGRGPATDPLYHTEDRPVTTAVTDDVRPSVVHSLPGRLRVHLPRYTAHGRRLAGPIRRLPGVTRARANPLTGNVLIEFDPRATDEDRLLDGLAELGADAESEPGDEATPPHAVVEKHPGGRRAHVAVRGIDRRPDLARRAVERLERHPGVRARADPLTGRLVLDLARAAPELDELLDEVAGLELLPETPDDAVPSHPLEPAPLVQSIVRLTAALLGQGVIAAREAVTGERRPRPLVRGAVTASAVITLVQGFPALRTALRKVLGRDAADVVRNTAGILAATLAGGPLTLALAAGNALSLLEMTRERRAGWRRYEAAPGRAVPTHPGTVTRHEAGDRVPALARVVEGAGTATDRDGLPTPVRPGARVTAGARLHGGPFTLELAGHPPFEFVTRPVPAGTTAYDRYLRAQGYVSLGYAAVIALRTWSFLRTFQALLLVNPLVALVGAEAANRLAAARAARGGVTVVGSRRNRPVRLPDVLLIDGPRVLTHGLELTAVLPLTDEHEPAELQAIAAGVSAACGSPWGPVFPPTGFRPAGHGRFEGPAATAVVDGVRHTLAAAGAEAARVRHRGEFVLRLARGEGEPLGLFAFRRRLATGVVELVRACRAHGVDCRLLGRGPAGEELARRAAVPLLEDRAMAAIRARQAAGAVVAFLSDSADAAAAFAACDLGIGLSSGRSGPFPARADLLASDLLAVAAVVETGARRGRAVRDAVGFSVLSNVVGAVRGWRGVSGLATATKFGNTSGIATVADAWARLRGGDRPRSALAYLADPRPERWGRREPEDVLRALDTTAGGLTTARARARRPRALPGG